MTAIAKTRLTIALDVLAEIERKALTPPMIELLDAAETSLTLLEADLDGNERPAEVVEHARLLGIPSGPEH